MGNIADMVEAMIKAGSNGREIVAAIRQIEDAKPKPAGEFAVFWAAYPARIGKGAAEKAFEKARKAASAQEILDGVMRYAAKTDDRPWCNPATFLNQRRWEDELPQPIAPTRGLAGVRQRLMQEIANGEPRIANADHDAAGGVPIFQLEHHGRDH